MKAAALITALALTACAPKIDTVAIRSKLLAMNPDSAIAEADAAFARGDHAVWGQCGLAMYPVGVSRQKAMEVRRLDGLTDECDSKGAGLTHTEESRVLEYATRYNIEMVKLAGQ